MLEEIPIAASLVALLVGVGVVVAALAVGFLLARREVKGVHPTDVLRDP